MRFSFSIILGLFCLYQTGHSVELGVCFEKDEVPVDMDALYDYDCVDLEGNIYGQNSSLLHSCCDCFRFYF